MSKSGRYIYDEEKDEVIKIGEKGNCKLVYGFPLEGRLFENLGHRPKFISNKRQFRDEMKREGVHQK